MNDARKEYSDIIDAARHMSEKHPPMPRSNRAAQFSPFAALTGYEDLIQETERETERRIELDESRIEALNRKLLFLIRRNDPIEARFTYFVPDEKKAGGAYESVSGKLRRYDRFSRSITLSDGTIIFIDDIRDIQIEDFWDEEGYKLP